MWKRNGDGGSKMTSESNLHPFEKAGLGKAPFRYVGMVCQEVVGNERVLNGPDAGIMVTTKPGGTCDACGHAIVDMYGIESSDGVRSKVGCDCILKVSKVSPVADQAKLAKDVKVAKKAKTDARKVVEAERIKAAQARVSEAVSLAAEPHPYQWGREQGKTKADYVAWMFANTGHTGRLVAARIVEKSIRS